MGSVRTPIIGRPRPLPGQRRAVATYTVNCEEPFFRALRSSMGGDAVPYVWVPEWHKTGHGVRLHFAVGRYIPRAAIEVARGRGFVGIKLLSDLPVGSGAVEEARRAAGYLSKYVTKSFTDAVRPTELHRFDVAQGFKPRGTQVYGRSAEDALAAASELMGSRPVRQWSSSQVEDWPGAPTIWAQWAA